MIDDINAFVWAEHYRPRTTADLITAPDIKARVDTILKQGHVGNLLLVGKPGIGKSTIARLIVENLGSEYLFVNASMDGNIDSLRTTIKQFCSTSSFNGDRKYVILDEADGANPQSFQPALRAFMDTYAENCGFILTANYMNKLLGPLIDRFQVQEFTIPRSKYPELAMEFTKRSCNILTEQGITFEKDVIARYVVQNTPNWRKILNGLQHYALGAGCIDVGILNNQRKSSLDHLIPHLRTKNFPDARKWVAENLDSDISSLYTDMAEQVVPSLQPASVGDFFIILARYQYQSAFVADQHVNLAACLAEIMVSCLFQE